ncbi:MAG TPA: HAMP domain-containing sensor histidine kinase [Pseudonocardia sp.]|nr:HAMP domain-containing sensor histidine kinase [Pseudonocardia sp.]
MADRGAPTPDGSPVPARLRIVGWIVLTAALGLLAVVLTVRSALLTDVERAANSAVVQEVDEFRTFAARGRDPDTGAPFASADRLVALYLERQYPGEGEALVGYDHAAAAAGTAPLIVQATDDRFGLLADPQLVPNLVNGPAVSGVGSTAVSEFRWGEVEVAGADGGPGASLLVAEFLAPGRAEADRIVQLVALVCLGGLALVAGIAYAVAGQILAPVRAVRRAASRITRADLSRRIEVRGRDDVAALAVTFNAMLDRLQAAFRTHQELSTAAGRHLRGPVAVLADDASPPSARAVARRQVAVILDDLDVLARSQDPEFVVPAPTDLADLTHRLVVDVQAMGGARWAADGSAAGTALLDGARIRQAVHCLARNALQQPGSGIPLRLGSRVAGDHVEFWVADDGPGLPPERAERLLHGPPEQEAPGGDAPARVGNGETRPGLGLAVVRAVADAHQGVVWLDTEEGRGATFGLRLPLRSPS